MKMKSMELGLIKQIWSVEQKKIMDHFDDFTGGEKN